MVVFAISLALAAFGAPSRRWNRARSVAEYAYLAGDVYSRASLVLLSRKSDSLPSFIGGVSKHEFERRRESDPRRSWCRGLPVGGFHDGAIRNRQHRSGGRVCR